MKRRFYHLDVFTRRPYTGNPLAVFLDADDLPHRTMQAIAREMNLSETVFVQKPKDDRALARLRIFTTRRELPLAGHPVIGTWHLLAELGIVPVTEGTVRVLQETQAGLLPVDILFEAGRPEMVAMTQLPARFRPSRIRLQALAAALGLRPADLRKDLPCEIVSTGIPNLLVPLKSLSALGRIERRPSALQQLLGGRAVMVYCFVLTGTRVRARGILPWELGEDPATGSAAGSLGAYLVRHGQWPVGRPLQIVQGVEMGRRSEIFVSIQKDNGRLIPRVSGMAVGVLSGHLEI